MQMSDIVVGPRPGHDNLKVRPRSYGNRGAPGLGRQSISELDPWRQVSGQAEGSPVVYPLPGVSSVLKCSSGATPSLRATVDQRSRCWHPVCSSLGMKISARLTPFVGLLVVGLMATACSEATTAVLPSSPTSIPSSAQSALIPTNTTWTLQSLTETGATEVTIADPSIFTLLLTDDGKVQARADCNRASAGYTVTDHTLSVGLIASTRAYCASAPVDGQYLALLGGENVVTTSGADLQLSSSRGTLRFVR